MNFASSSGSYHITLKTWYWLLSTFTTEFSTAIKMGEKETVPHKQNILLAPILVSTVSFDRADFPILL